uniref:Uncharacterized protein n=1 Tax=Timema genevievae TaxID=629358 RepID=A0A7R9PHR0_TIMGE|nr:unnamed protein product [Timema genevievae]
MTTSTLVMVARATRDAYQSSASNWIPTSCDCRDVVFLHRIMTLHKMTQPTENKYLHAKTYVSPRSELDLSREQLIETKSNHSRYSNFSIQFAFSRIKYNEETTSSDQCKRKRTCKEEGCLKYGLKGGSALGRLPLTLHRKTSHDSLQGERKVGRKKERNPRTPDILYHRTPSYPLHPLPQPAHDISTPDPHLHALSHPSDHGQFPSTTIQWEHLTWEFAEILNKKQEREKKSDVIMIVAEGRTLKTGEEEKELCMKYFEMFNPGEEKNESKIEEQEEIA